MKEKLKKILYVEDDEDIAEVGQMTLEDIGGFDVKYCSSGKAALESFIEYRPQLVLMDVMMPEMDGTETLSKLRELDGGENTPVIFMTAKAQTHEQISYIKMGVLGVIVKPFDPMKLCDDIILLWESGRKIETIAHDARDDDQKPGDLNTALS